MLQIKFLRIGNHGIAEAAGFQRGKGIFLAPQAIDSVKILGTDGSIRFAPDISLGIFCALVEILHKTELR